MEGGYFHVTDVEGIGERVKKFMYLQRNFTETYSSGPNQEIKVYKINNGKVIIDSRDNSLMLIGGNERIAKRLSKLVKRSRR